MWKGLEVIIGMNVGKYFLSLILTASLFLVSCQGTDEINITAEQFINLLDTSAYVIILDVRTASEYQEGHLEDALLVSLHEPDFPERIRSLDKSKTYLVYCRSGSRSRSAVNTMRKEGFTKAYNVRGGILGLAREGVRLVE